MNEQIVTAAMRVLEEHHGFARTKDFIRAGISPYYIKKLESIGEIERVKQGVYRQAGQINELPNEMVEVSKLVPKGVICLLSALSYYELTTYNPWEYHVAIHRDGKKPKLPDYPPIKIIYLADAQFNTGIDEISIDGSAVKIYDREKTICDMVRYREKIGIDLMKEGLRNYLQSRHKNITRLVSYAEKLRIRTVLQKYLEVLI
ncbi:type IV toxin-antitoxin system AbiEi family antitoxin domain-containing protein [Paenibacillus sp. GCM10012307]|uniref:Type IV toxin-antitoxin system AbiEi family antitoxin domain-containing protein n=1 Tax=Paenibacillus roseus TaxID=2798579 RepID=A0A934JBL6_9BACL|nr:type IV toxin-antitoxin system AbiEi family antitoxin domain-containing protein [Paenibacillus roseus]MBJ6363830.1 type IV toxin-antitoxin system AbiEi family antitoxin domain-containing protein [Paenibacillus roseus]